MAEIDRQVVATADDAHANVDSAGFWNDPIQMQLIYAGYAWRSYHRLTDVTIPKGAVITAAYISFCAAGDSVLGGVITIKGFLETDVGNFPDRTTSDGYSLTEASINWTLGAWTGLEWYNSDSLVDIIQEIVNQAGWASGNHMGFRIDAVDQPESHAICSFEMDGNIRGLKLHVEYILPMAGGMQVPAVVALDLI